MTPVSADWTRPAFALALEALGDLPARAAIVRSREIGYQAVGIPAGRKEFAPSTLGESGARDLASFLTKTGLTVSWVRAGQKGRFAVSSTLQEDVERTLSVIDLAKRLRAGCAAAHVGQLGEAKSPAAANLRQALDVLADAADRAAVRLALEPSQGEEAILDEVLVGVADAPLGRLLNPGQSLFAGVNPIDDVMAAGKIVAVAACDSSSDAANLAPGEGRVPWRDFLAALAARDYYECITTTFAPDKNSVMRASRALELLCRYGVS